MITNKNECACSSSDKKESTCCGGDTIQKTAIFTQTTSVLSFADYWGMLRMRLGFNRSNYKTQPGLYRIGNPDKFSPVFVSANYKFSFDVLRKNLSGIDGWILVIDSKGINVWCAAGKGTFGTKELVNRIRLTALDTIVNHKKLILPQLSGPGVAGFEVREQTGFSVIWGPVRASDIKEFLKNGKKTDPPMRRVLFGFKDRFVLTPLELVSGLKIMALVFLALLILSFIRNWNSPISLVMTSVLNDFLPLAAGIVTGTVLVPLALPILPGRAFSLKGAFAGLILALVWAAITIPQGFSFHNYPWLPLLPFFFILPAFSSFAAINFTGASTYTSLSGVIKEMRIAMPLIIIFGAIGCISLILFRLLGL